MNKKIHYITAELKNYRTKSGWTQQQLADFLTLHLGKRISKETVNYWENQTRAVNAKTALDIATATKIPIMDLVKTAIVEK